MFEDEHAFLDSAYQFREKLFYIALSRLKDEDEANDAVIDVILKAREKRHQLREDSKLLSWLARIMINHCNDLFRAAGRERPLPDEPIADDRQDIADRFRIAQEIEKILDIMLTLDPPEHRDVVILYFYRKMSYAEIAEMLEIPEGTVKSRLNRARQNLLQKFREADLKEEDLRTVKDMDGWPLL